MSWNPEVVGVHEAGHWTTAHVCGVANDGVELSLADPSPGQLLGVRRDRFISMRDRSLIGWAGYAAELLVLGANRADISHAVMDWGILNGRGQVNDALEQSQDLLIRHRRLFDEVAELLTTVASAGTAAVVSGDQLCAIAEAAEVGFGVEALPPTFDEGRDWLVHACETFASRQMSARDVAVTSSNPGMLSATVKVSSSELPGSDPFINDWRFFEQDTAASGFTVTSTEDRADFLGHVDLALTLSFTAGD